MRLLNVQGRAHGSSILGGIAVEFAEKASQGLDRNSFRGWKFGRETGVANTALTLAPE